jgi:hypothetical protein
MFTPFYVILFSNFVRIFKRLTWNEDIKKTAGQQLAPWENERQLKL